ncbi:MAG: hypothetical protein IKI80_04600 [Bacteroidaceae bacterium]|nr:hypothetical protein [Bacteroidaceae bacterium]
MKHIILLSLMFVSGIFAMAQTDNSLEVYILDPTGTDTNVRNSPKGKVVDKIPVDGEWILFVSHPRNGWWRIDDGEYYDAVPDTNPDSKPTSLKGSTTGYWVHYSCIGFTLVGGSHKLRATPSTKGKVTSVVDHEVDFHPLELKGEWVKIVSLDGKHTGWITQDMICSNPLTTCP